MNEKEVGWWDQWNARNRSGGVEPDSLFGELGALVHREVSSLPVQDLRVIEIGCGTGWFAERLRSCRRYVGLDLSPEAIKVAQSRVPGARFVVADFHDWHSGDDRFDLAIMVDTVAYFRDQDLALTKLAKMLEPGATLVLSTVNPFVYSRISWVGPPGDGQVRKWLDRTALHALLRRCGFDVVRYYTVLPAGDRGFLRILNSPKTNRPAQWIVPASWIRRAKERCGLGQFQIAIARKRV